MHSDLVFDEETHTYRYKGNIVPSVTTILSDVGISDFSGIPEATLKYAAERGTAVHLATEFYDTGVLDTLPDLIAPYLESYKKFLTDFEVEIKDVEKRIFCPKYCYAGTLDRTAIFKKVSDSLVLFDIKTGQPCRSHKIQTAGYEQAIKEDKRKKMDRYTLYLSENGYKLDGPYRDRKDFDVFLAALSVYNYKRIK